jgi:hypothetical protein
MKYYMLNRIFPLCQSFQYIYYFYSQCNLAMAEAVVDISRFIPGRGDSPTGHPVPRGHRQREQSTRSTNETLDRDGVLATLGYKPDKSWKTSVVLLDRSELCIRCGKKVYPVEKIDVGGLYHRSCFRCKVRIHECMSRNQSKHIKNRGEIITCLGQWYRTIWQSMR